MLGLVSAIRNAGARNVIASLWAVDDEATRDLMQMLYAELLGRRKRVSPVRALRAAALELRRQLGMAE